MSQEIKNKLAALRQRAELATTTTLIDDNAINRIEPFLARLEKLIDANEHGAIKYNRMVQQWDLQLSASMADLANTVDGVKSDLESVKAASVKELQSITRTAGLQIRQTCQQTENEMGKFRLDFILWTALVAVFVGIALGAYTVYGEIRPLEKKIDSLTAQVEELSQRLPAASPGTPDSRHSQPKPKEIKH